MRTPWSVEQQLLELIVRPLFTVHAGEFVVGELIEKTFPGLDIWVPAKDTGVDLLVTGIRGQQALALQVKLSRDYKPFEAKSDFDKRIVAAGWLTLDHEKMAKSKADLWVVVLISHERTMKPQFLVIPPHELLRRLSNTHGKSKKYQFYPWVTKDGKCLDGRGLMRTHKRQRVEGTIVLGTRDLSAYLGDWSALSKLSQQK